MIAACMGAESPARRKAGRSMATAATVARLALCGSPGQRADHPCLGRDRETYNQTTSGRQVRNEEQIRRRCQPSQAPPPPPPPAVGKLGTAGLKAPRLKTDHYVKYRPGHDRALCPIDICSKIQSNWVATQSTACRRPWRRLPARAWLGYSQCCWVQDDRGQISAPAAGRVVIDATKAERASQAPIWSA